MQTAGYQVAQTQKIGVRPGRLMSGAAIVRLATLEPKPIVNLTGSQGVFAPHSKHRAMITTAVPARGSKKEQSTIDQDERTLAAHQCAK